jgi:hypothetical protein
LEAEWLAFAGELDRREAWAADGSLSGGAWLARHCSMAGSTAREKLRVARKLLGMPATAAAYAAGTLGWSHLRVLARAVHERTAEAFTRDEAMLLHRAGEQDADAFARFVRRWEATVDVDGPEPPAFDQDRNALQLAESFQGRWLGRINLDAESGAILHGAIQGMAEELWRAQGAADAAASLRPASVRYAEALLELVHRGLAADGARPAQPLLVATLDLDELAAGAGLPLRLPSGSRLSGEAARRLACDAGVVRALTAGGSEVLDLGRATRTPNRAQRRAKEALHEHCAFPGCTRPFRWCQLHHIVHWIDGGPTDLENLVPLCSRHHHLHHEGRFRIVRRPDRTLYVVDPEGRWVGDVDVPGTPAAPPLAA